MLLYANMLLFRERKPITTPIDLSVLAGFTIEQLEAAVNRKGAVAPAIAYLLETEMPASIQVEKTPEQVEKVDEEYPSDTILIAEDGTLHRL